ncbi:MAG TPA: hypothetical protein VHG53_05435 [Candidatus Limnocylindria bacterium]|nr:hypothetical protein [Candidatus Limnocylindria bacterium]
MESELIAVGMVLLAVAAVLMVALGAGPTPLTIHMEIIHVESGAHALLSQLADRLPH